MNRVNRRVTYCHFGASVCWVIANKDEGLWDGNCNPANNVDPKFALCANDAMTLSNPISQSNNLCLHTSRQQQNDRIVQHHQPQYYWGFDCLS